jgi:deazaflavin-dependent oxidoreductase (nitroreductase family)
MNGNDFMAWVLRSPFHGLLSNNTMLITVKGRKSGRCYTTPVGYYQEGEYLWVVTNRDRTWWRNIKDEAEVDLLLKNKPVHGTASTEADEEVVKTQLRNYIKCIPQAAKPMGIPLGQGKACEGDVALAARTRLFVKIKLMSKT